MTSINLEIIPPSFSLNSDLAYIPEVGEVVVLAADIRPATSPDLNGLSFDEQRRARSMGASEVRDRFVAGRHLLRQTLAPWLGMDPSAIELVVGEGGKPYVKQDPSLHFSISHSGEILLAAFSRTDIGVDLELSTWLVPRLKVRKWNISSVSGPAARRPSKRMGVAWGRC